MNSLADAHFQTAAPRFSQNVILCAPLLFTLIRLNIGLLVLIPLESLNESPRFPRVNSVRSFIVLKANRLKKYFDQGSRQIKAVDDVSLSIQSGEILGLVGESGSGKSTLGKLLIRLLESTSGEIQFRGKNFLSLSGQKLRNERRNIQMIFQDPYGSLDPRMTVVAQPTL